jgi:hypothetical protein
MNRITRLLAIAGMSAGAALALAGPAQAATADASHKAPVAAKADWGNDDRIVRIFPSRGQCETVGEIGESSGRWDDHDCFRVGGGWALSVSEDDWNDWDGPFSLGGFRFGGNWGGFQHSGFHGGFHGGGHHDGGHHGGGHHGGGHHGHH